MVCLPALAYIFESYSAMFAYAKSLIANKNEFN